MKETDSPRRGTRFHAGIPSELHDASGSTPCSAHDVSRTGALLVGPIRSPSGVADLTLKAPTGTLEVRLPARVARELPDTENGERQIAFEFEALTPDQKEGLEALLSRLIEGAAPGPLESLRPGAPPNEVRKALEQIPIPHRISLATRAGVREREWLRQDIVGAVLEALARNPNLLAADVKVLLSSPHVLPSTLEILANDSRFKGDDEIQLGLAAHPKVPPPVGERLVEGMKGTALRQLLRRPGMNPVLRERVVRKLSRS